VRSLLASARNPQYTGENRCSPCTILNLLIATALAVAVGVVSVPAGATVLLVSVAIIYVRGYLIPGTPTLTKRYAPSWLLALFGKADRPVGEWNGGQPGDAPPDGSGDASAAAGGEADVAADSAVDPESLLADAGVVEECADENDLCLADRFVGDWKDAVDRLREDADAREATASALFDREAVRIDFDENGRAVARVDGGTRDDWRVGSWPTEGAMVADLAAGSVLADRVAAWDDVAPTQRAGIAKALRSFMPECPLCGGRVAMTDDTVESCCQSFDVIAVRCLDCAEHYLELDPERVRDAETAA
jgi:hypothetical protein